ncbi:uncharacterized protein [Dermacentor albipictus]|uniref:uncharacterized protein n=1 Tax=Dermacentor albipictus TaxID=60249 RepID=UPI0038FC76C9
MTEIFEVSQRARPLVRNRRVAVGAAGSSPSFACSFCSCWFPPPSLFSQATSDQPRRPMTHRPLPEETVPPVRQRHLGRAVPTPARTKASLWSQWRHLRRHMNRATSSRDSTSLAVPRSQPSAPKAGPLRPPRLQHRLQQSAPKSRTRDEAVNRIRDMFWPTAKIVYKVEFDSKKNIDYFIDMCRNTQMPDLIVVTAHDYFPGPDVKKQVLLPPNIYYRPIDFWYQANYGHTVPEAMAEALTVLNNGVSRPISLVLTMAGTKARMQYPDIRNPKAGRCAIYQPAVNEYRSSWHTHLTNPKAMCSGKAYEAYRANLQYQENALTWLAFNKTLNVSTSMAFDTAETLRDKICNVFVNHTDDDLTQKIDFGISELAWDRDPCDLPSWKSPPYERVRMVRAVSKFLTDEYWDPTDLYFCLKVKP